MKTKILFASNENIEICARCLREGGLVAFPTETVYGLGANAILPKSCEKIFTAKGRPSDNPLIVHLGDVEQIDKYATVTEDARRLIAAFMPGALTILLKKNPCIPDIVTAGRETVGIRVPSSEICRRFLRACNVPVCAPSANTSTKPSPTLARHVYDDLCGKIDLILDGGSCDIGLESTIVDVTRENPVLLRKGGILINDIERVLEKKVVILDTSKDALSPGLKYRHYSPKARVLLGDESHLLEMYLQSKQQGHKVMIMCYSDMLPLLPKDSAISVGENAEDYAKNFYSLLRLLDKKDMEVIICQLPKEIGIGSALLNRMTKAASPE